MAAFSLYNLQTNPIIQFLVPFILVFAVVYAGLKASGVIQGKNLNAVIAAAISLFAVAYPPLNAFLWQTMPFAALGILLLSLALVFWNIGKKFGIDGKAPNVDALFTGVNVAVLLILLGTYQNQIHFSWIDANQVMWAVGIAAVLYLVAKAYKEAQDKFGNQSGH